MKKRYIVMIIILIILILGLVAGLSYKFLFTSKLKSNKQLFSKHLIELKELPTLLKDEELTKYIEKQKNTPYTSVGTLKTNATFPDNSHPELSEALQNCNISFNTKTDLANQYSYSNIKANYSDSQSLNFEFIQNKDIYAFKINEVLKKFIGIQNKDLKKLAKKFNIDNELISIIPDKLKFKQIYFAKLLDDETLKQLKSKYLSVITSELNDDMFSKEVSDDNTVYTLTIDPTQAKNIFIKLLENLKNDELLFNKLKDVLCTQAHISEDKVNTYINHFKEIINTYLEEDKKQTDNIMKVFLKNSISNEQSETILQQLLSIDGVVSANIVSQTDAFQQLKDAFGNKSYLLENYNEDILPISYNITISDKSKYDSIKEQISRIEGIDKISDNIKSQYFQPDMEVVINTYVQNDTLSKVDFILKDSAENNDTSTSNSTTSTSKSGENKFTIMKIADGIRLEYSSGLQDSQSYSLSLHKIKSENELKYDISSAINNDQIFDIITTFNDINTDTVQESSEFSFEYDDSSNQQNKDSSNNIDLQTSKTKLICTYSNTKTFSTETLKNNIKNNNILLINTAPNADIVTRYFTKIMDRTLSINAKKLANAKIKSTENPFVYYIPSVIPLSITNAISNPNHTISYTLPPTLVLSGVSIAMLSGDNGILHKASEASSSYSIGSVKDEISLLTTEAVTDYYEDVYVKEKVETYSLEELDKKIIKSIKKYAKSDLSKYNVTISVKDNTITITYTVDGTTAKGTISNGKITWDK